MVDRDGPFVRLAKWLALFTALVISLGTPSAYLYFGYQGAIGELTGEITFKARQVSRLINANPEYWEFEELRINGLIDNSGMGSSAEIQRVFNDADEIVVQRPKSDPAFFWPTLVQTKPVFDYGVPVGRIEITKSLRPIYESTLMVALGSLLAGLIVYWGLRVVPLRVMRKAWERISYLASHDMLTNLPNRAMFLETLELALSGARLPRLPVTVYSIDLDHFKDINDTLGHAAGDRLLRLAADRMQNCLRQGDTLGRLGGDEFAIFQVGIGDFQAASQVAERIIEELSRPFNLDGLDALIGVSIGLSTYDGDGAVTSDQLLQHADLALYKSKNNGRGTFHFFQEDMDAKLKARKSLEIDIRKALRTDEFELHYQPQVDLVSQRILGVEALLRWQHPERGNVPPLEIIPVMETSGLIYPLTEWVLLKACREALLWAPLRVAVNLSPVLFQKNGLVEMVEQALETSGLPAERLELEITEAILLVDTERTLEVLRRLKELGVHIAMDDFGTGYSSLSYLRRFPFDKIKIDRSFISDLDHDTDAQAIVRAIIGMSQALKMQINAEGVETIEQANVLRAEGCKEVQGFLFGRPMRRSDIEVLLASTHTLTTPQEEGDEQKHSRPALVHSRKT